MFTCGDCSWGSVSHILLFIHVYCWFCLSVTAEDLFRKNITKHNIIATVATEVSREITAIVMAAIVATSFIEVGIPVSANKS